MNGTDPHICPVCHGYVGIQEDGTLFPHERYADGAGYGPQQPHTLVPCKGGAAEIIVSDSGRASVKRR